MGLSGYCVDAVTAEGGPQMITFDLLQFAAVAFAVCGLVVVVMEIVLTNPGWLWEMISDVRDFAGRSLPRPKGRDAKSAPTPENTASRDPRTSA